MQKFSFTGKILTDAQGTQQLVDFYNQASQYKNCWFTLDFDKLQWIDANLSAELFLYCYLLKSRLGIKFFIEYSVLRGDLNVLNRNRFAYYVVENRDSFKPDDTRDSVIPLKAFKIEDADSFVKYIEGSFLNQRGLLNLDQQSRERLKGSYFEIFDNVGIHANSETPIFCCGQYFPHSCELKFTMVDYGNGFLKKIAAQNLNEITTGAQAIDWAVKGGSTKDGGIPGGTGLKKITMYCLKTGGEFSIVSDGCYWSLKGGSINTLKIKNHLKGATIHLTFRYLK